MRRLAAVAVCVMLAACSGVPTVPDKAADARATCVYGTGVYGHGYVLLLGADRATQGGSKGNARIKCGDSEATFTEATK